MDAANPMEKTGRTARAPAPPTSPIRPSPAGRPASRSRRSCRTRQGLSPVDLLALGPERRRRHRRLGDARGRTHPSARRPLHGHRPRTSRRTRGSSVTTPTAGSTRTWRTGTTRCRRTSRLAMLDDLAAVLADHCAPLEADPRPWGWKEPRSIYLLPFLAPHAPRAPFPARRSGRPGHGALGEPEPAAQARGLRTGPELLDAGRALDRALELGQSRGEALRRRAPRRALPLRPLRGPVRGAGRGGATDSRLPRARRRRGRPRAGRRPARFARPVAHR